MVKSYHYSITVLNNQGFMKQSLERRITFFAFVILAMTLLASTAMEIVVIRKDYTNEFQLRAETIGTSLKTSIEKVLALGVLINDINGITDKCRESIQADPDMEYCIITDVNGNILFSSNSQPYGHTSLSDQLKAHYNTSAKEIVTTKSSRIGEFLNTLTPVKSFDSSIAAHIHIGFHRSTIDNKIQAIVLRSIIVLLVFFLISFATVVFFVKKNIVTPISALLNSVKNISSGDYTTNIQQLSILEFNVLAENINQMSFALESRDKELRKNYDELTSTHSHLHSSYLQLESLSLELEKSEELFRKILEESGNAILILDKSEHVIIANKRCTDLLGISHEEIIGQHISSILLSINVENITHLLKFINTAFNNEPFSEEMVFSNGEQQRIANLSISNISLGEKKLLQLLIRDVTQEREILSNLEQSTVGLTRLNKMKDSFLGLASHELKTPLTVILGYSELLQNDMKDHLSDTAAEMIVNISNAAIRLDEIVKDMIDMNLFDQKQVGLNRVSLDLNLVIESTIQELKFFFALRRQEVIIKLDPSLPMFEGDRSRLMQMFTNVIGNAIKFTPDGGTICITTAVRRIFKSVLAEQKYQDAIEVTVSDTGIGINSDEQIKIFDKFYEAGNIEEHSSGKVAFKSRGAGLGLSIAKGIAEIHGGKIWVESIGQNLLTFPGSTFFILLPIETGSKL